MADLKAIYTKLYATVPWPEPIPRPDQVILRWNRRFVHTQGRCTPMIRMIEISSLYQDPRLRRELVHLMMHEAAHFIWVRHQLAYKEFLRNCGVLEGYIGHKVVSETLEAVRAEHFPSHRPRYVWGCTSCGQLVYSYRRQAWSCRRCDTKWNPHFTLVLLKDRKLNPDAAISLTYGKEGTGPENVLVRVEWE